jgi:hypothetical protein
MAVFKGTLAALAVFTPKADNGERAVRAKMRLNRSFFIGVDREKR